MRFDMRAVTRNRRGDPKLDPAKRQDTGSCLPSELVSTTSDCAISCLQDFVKRSFGNPSCSDSSDLTYLCRTISLTGYTIGEGGLQCLIQNCSTSQSLPPDAQKNVYNICGSISGSRPKTQATVTVTISPSSTASNPLVTNIQVASITSTASNSIASDTSVPPNLASYGFVTASAPFPASTDPAPAPKPGPGAGQTAGIAVGSAAGAFGLIGLMFFFCRRRRKQTARRKTNSPVAASTLMSASSSASTSRNTSPEPKVEDVVPRQAVNPSPVETITAAVEAAAAGVSASTILAAANANMSLPTKTQRTRSYWRKSIKPEEIGVAVTPKEENDGFRKSNGSSLKQNPRSMIPVPESAVLPTAYTSITTIDGAAADMLNRGSYANAAAAAAAAAAITTAASRSEKAAYTQQYSPVPQSSVYDRGVQGEDVEAQTGSRPVTQHSLLASARASLSELGMMLKRSVSLKRQASDAKPLLKPTVYSAKAAQPVNRYPLTPKYDNGYFEPNDSLASTTVSPEPYQIPPVPTYAIPRKPTFSSFVAGKLLHSTTFKSPPPATSRDQPPAMPAMPKGIGLYSAKGQEIGAMVHTTESQAPEKTLAIPRGMSDVRSPAMMPAPLTIRKTPSSKTVRTQASARTPRRNMNSSAEPTVPPNMGQIRSVYQAAPRSARSRKALEMMGLSSPVDAHKYARKPLPTPSHPPNPFARLAPILEPKRLSAVETLSAVKASQHENAEVENKDVQDIETPLSTATSWLSVPVSTQPGTTRVTMIPSPPQGAQSSAYQSPESASPRGNPGFPSMAQSLNSIYTKYNYSEPQLPAIAPTSAITLTAAIYKPEARNSPPVPPLPQSSQQQLSISDMNLGPGHDEDVQQESTSPDRVTSGFQSNISTPPRFTKSINPYNPYFPDTPMRQKSTSSSRSQSLALSSHPTPAIPEFVYPEPSSSQDFSNIQRSNGAYFRTPSLRPTIPGRNGSRQPSSLFSPDSADPRRESEGFPKVVVTPNKLPGGDMVLTVDTTGKGYGV